MRFIDKGAAPVNAVHMEPDESLARSNADPAVALARQDIDRLSVDELHARIALLETEIARCRAKIDASVNHRATADALFRQ